ncbi:uncharacterized protein LOC142083869 [Calonectris borealis]|uniref:uncharacterized protein LOC142083869 n=1 Tax=Calonectris borealis TaxID=1323832 RepID=UPI003F4BB6E7
MVTAVAQGAVRPVPPLGGRRSGVLLAAVLSEGAASIASAGSFSAGLLGGRGGCGTPTQAHLEGCHHRKCRFARLPLRDTLVPALQQVPTPATLQWPLVPPEPIPRHPWLAIPLAPLRLAPTHQGSTPMGTPRWGIIPMGTPIRDHQECQGTHRTLLATIRSTIRSTRRSTQSTPSTMEASTPAAQAAVLTLTEEDISHPHGSEQNTKANTPWEPLACCSTPFPFLSERRFAC